MLFSHFFMWQFKYKEDLDWVKGIGCYVWDTPLLKQAEHNKALYSEVKDLESSRVYLSIAQKTDSISQKLGQSKAFIYFYYF